MYPIHFMLYTFLIEKKKNCILHRVQNKKKYLAMKNLASKACHEPPQTTFSNIPNAILSKLQPIL